MSIRRLAASDLKTQLCDFPIRAASSLCVKPAFERISTNSDGTFL